MSEPTKGEISQVFKRLRGIGPNKVSQKPSVEILLEVHEESYDDCPTLPLANHHVAPYVVCTPRVPPPVSNRRYGLSKPELVIIVLCFSKSEVTDSGGNMSALIF